MTKPSTELLNIFFNLCQGSVTVCTRIKGVRKHYLRALGSQNQFFLKSFKHFFILKSRLLLVRPQVKTPIYSQYTKFFYQAHSKSPKTSKTFTFLSRTLVWDTLKTFKTIDHRSPNFTPRKWLYNHPRIIPSSKIPLLKPCFCELGCTA